MDRDEKKVSKFTKKLVAFIGYWWITLSVMIAIWQLFDFVYDYEIPSPWNWIAIVGIIIVSLVIGILLTCSFPFFLDVLFNKSSSEEKYFNINSETEMRTLQATIHASLPSMRDEEMLLEPIKESCLNDQMLDYDKALEIGRTNSKLLNRLDKNYLRIINGIYSLYALEKKYERKTFSSNHKKYTFIKHYFLINDIGWSLYELSDREWETLKHKCDKFLPADVKQVVDQHINWQAGAKQNSISIIKKSLRLLDTYHPVLIAQAYRHLLSFKECRAEDLELNKYFELAIKRIKNYDERQEMEGNKQYLQAKLKYDKVSDDSSSQIEVLDAESKIALLQEALECVNHAMNKFKSIDDLSKRCKCFNLKGKILEAQGKKTDAEQCFKDGLYYSLSIQRYDQILRNLESLVKLSNDDREKYAKQGLKTAIKIKNRKYENIFMQICRTQHIFLVRHGESDKNMDKTISGEGNLTTIGRAQIQSRREDIERYLSECGYKPEDVVVYGIEKTQVKQTIQELQKNNKYQVKYENDLLRPISMGQLSGKQENDSDSKVKRQLMLLYQWRNGDVCARDLAIADMEPFDQYWARAKEFITNITEGSEDAPKVKIVVCTTSTAILLTQYLLNSEMKPEEYRCIDFPLGGVVHFRGLADNNGFEMVNKNEVTNIAFTAV